MLTTAISNSHDEVASIADELFASLLKNICLIHDNNIVMERKLINHLIILSFKMNIMDRPNRTAQHPQRNKNQGHYRQRNKYRGHATL